ncbi:MAG: class I SAM-dependent methyltransferase [Candidatus Taylorbacteria bacterium]|nr:class I SAM-dependent methyltransferase [Candidatus Taylorbacteria bacterium]
MAVPITKAMIVARNDIVRKMKNGEYRTTENPCICGKINGIILAENDRYDIPIKTVLCESCGLVRSDPYYDENTLGQFYSKEYRPLYTGTDKATSEFFMSQKTFGRIIKNLLSEKIFNGKLTGKRIFEIGCGAGGILEAFKENGNEVFGCDYGRSYIEFGNTRNLNLVEGSAETLKQFGTADIVILNHTLEHMLKPQEELERIKTLLSPNGVLYIALPGIYSIHDTYRGDLMGYLQNAHVWYFTLKTLNSLLAKSGFELIYGNEIITAIYKSKSGTNSTETENSKKILDYLKKTKRLRWYYALKKFSFRHVAFETFRLTGPLYRVTRGIYRKLKQK